MIRRSALVACLVLVPVGCSEPSAPMTHLRISGAVTDLSTGSPIPGAVVVLETIEGFLFVFPSVPIDSVTTDAQGRYALTFDDDTRCLGILRLRATAPNFSTGYTNDASGNSVRCTSEMQVLNIRLLRSSP